MASRVEKYSGKAYTTSNRRTSRNKELYNALYLEDESYSNIEGVVETSKTNEIDLLKVQEMLKKQEEEEKKKTQLVKKDLEIPDMASLDDEDEKNYDIRDVLDKIASSKVKDNKPRKLKNFDIEELKETLKTSKYTEEEQECDLTELTELMDTIAGSSTLTNGLSGLGDDLLDDLMDNPKDKKHKNESLSISQIIDEAKKNEKKKADDDFYETPSEMDRSFYTKTLDLKEEDFVETDEDKVMPVGLKIFLIILFILVAIVFVIVGYQVIKRAVL